MEFEPTIDLGSTDAGKAPVSARRNTVTAPQASGPIRPRVNPTPSEFF